MRILLHADASRQWEPAASIAARLARAGGGQVTVVTAERVKRRQQEVLRRAESLLALPKEQLALRAVSGLLEQVVPKVANEGFDLLVLAPLGGLDWLTHGHILSLLAARARTNTLLVRGAGAGFARALVATEGGPHGAVNLQAALELARVFDMQVHVMHVLSQVAIYDYIKEHPDLAFLESEHPIARHLRDLRTEVLRAGRDGEAKVRVGPVEDEILAEVRDGQDDLLVVGAHGGEESLLARDVASWLLRHSPVSTLVVRDEHRWLPKRGG